MTLIGYAQYAYQNGGGNITALPGAPQKFIAANDYRRVYDLEHGRMRHHERRNDLFPFANYGGHDFALQNQVLDGNVAYNVNAQGQAVRGGDVRDRRMWMHTNPIVAVRAVLSGSAMVSNRRQENGLTLVDLTLKEGDTMTMAIRATVQSAGVDPVVRDRMPISARSCTPRTSMATCPSTASACRWATPRSSIGATSTSEAVCGQLSDRHRRFRTWRRRPVRRRTAGPRRWAVAAARAAPTVQVTPVARGLWRSPAARW